MEPPGYCNISVTNITSCCQRTWIRIVIQPTHLVPISAVSGSLNLLLLWLLSKHLWLAHHLLLRHHLLLLSIHGLLAHHSIIYWLSHNRLPHHWLLRHHSITSRLAHHLLLLLWVVLRLNWLAIHRLLSHRRHNSLSISSRLPAHWLTVHVRLPWHSSHSRRTSLISWWRT